MEILFLYLDSNEIFKENLQLNFGGQYLFHYDSTAEELTVEANPYFIESFFNISQKGESAHVKNVTGIIGQNGAGKSSVLEYFRSILTRGLSGIRYKVILGLINHKNEKVVYHFDTFPIRKGNYEEFGFRTIEIRNRKQTHTSEAGFRMETDNPPEIDETQHLDLIFFSNVFDGGLEYEFEGSRNISTNFLLRNDVKNNLENKLINASDLHREVEQFLFEEISRQVDFVNNFEYPEVIPFDIPDRLIITPKKDFLDISQPVDPFDTDRFDYETRSILRQISELFESSIRDTENIKTKAEYRIIANCFLNFIYEIRDVFGYGFGTRIISEFSQLTSSNDNVINIKAFIVKIVSSFEEDFRKNDQLKKCVQGILNFINEVGKYIDLELVANDSGRMFFLDIRDKAKFRDFYNLYTQTFILRPFINFTWRNLSSGEKALFNIYARFFSLTDKIVKAANAKLKANLIILVDEGDLYLHPTWQKQFLFNLLKFLPTIYSRTEEGISRNLQIVITSNNPISVSDLPNSNLVFLEKGYHPVTVVDSLEDKKLTFAANIHTLYTDSFFLKGGLIGEFAKLKINNVIEILQGDRETILKNRDYLERFISFIGEPLIKSKLTQMFAERLQLNIVDLQNRVSTLESEVKQLKDSLNK
jgi:hypothetical protein